MGNMSIYYDNNYFEDDENVSKSTLILENISSGLVYYLIPIIIFGGCAGNLVSFAVYSRSKLRHQSTSQYLACLALVDTLYLCQFFYTWLDVVVDPPPPVLEDELCIFFVYLMCVWNVLDSWLVIAFTLERYIAIVYPLRMKALCTVKRARYVILILFGVSLVMCLPIIKCACIEASDSEDFFIWNLFITLITYTPFIIGIVVLNSCILVAVYRSGRAHQHLSKERSHRRVTVMLLTVSSLYVLLILPAYIMQFVILIINVDDQDRKLLAIGEILRVIAYLHFGIDFYVYCITGSNFRDALCEVFPWVKRLRRRPVVVPRPFVTQPVGQNKA